MLRIFATVLAGVALAACEQIPKSKGPDAAASPPASAAATDAVARAKLRSSVEVRRPAGAGSSAPARAGAYPAAVVNDLVIAASDRKNLTDAERAEFEAIKDELARLFGASFRDALLGTGYVASVVSEGAPIVIEPTLTQFTAPTNRGTMGGIHTGIMDVTVTVSDAKGALLGSYQLRYTAALLANRLPAMDIQRRVFPDAGAKAAQAIAR